MGNVQLKDTIPYGNDAPDLLDGIRDGAWLDKQDFPPVDYAVPGIIPEGSVLLVGPPKIGKSWFVLTVALAAASGGRALGIEVERRPVLYLALEDGHRRLQDRCRKLLLGEPIPEGFQYLIRVEPGRMFETIAAWAERQQNDAAPLVILDTLGKVMPPAVAGESTYQRDYRVGSALKDLADSRPGMTLLTNHHDRKASADDFVDSVSGTHGLAGAADTIVVLCRDRQEASGVLKVTGRDVPEGEYAVTFSAGAVWDLDGTDLASAAQKAATGRLTAGLGDRSVDVITYVHQHPAGVSPSEVGRALGLDSSTAGVYLSRAVDAGRLRKPQRGLYTPVESVGSVGTRRLTSNTFNTNNTPPRGAPEETATSNGDASHARTERLLDLDGEAPRSEMPAWCCDRCGHETVALKDMAGFPHPCADGGRGRFRAAERQEVEQ